MTKCINITFWRGETRAGNTSAFTGFKLFDVDVVYASKQINVYNIDENHTKKIIKVDSTISFHFKAL